MADHVAGTFEVGANERGEVVINLPPEMVADFSLLEGGHIVFSPNQARTLAWLLLKHAGNLECLWCKERYDRELSISCETPTPDSFCTPECERTFRKKRGPFYPR
jgi:hypothetical protein